MCLTVYSCSDMQSSNFGIIVVYIILPPSSFNESKLHKICYFVFLGMNIFVTFFLLLLVLAGQTPNAVKEFPLIGE